MSARLAGDPEGPPRDTRAEGEDDRPSRRFRDRVWRWYRCHVAELLACRGSISPTNDGRCIPLHSSSPLVDERYGRPYVSNAIRTSRYTLFDFFPKQLLFQFTRVGNFYFLCVGIPQAVPGLSTTGNFTTILPLLFFVLLTIAKEGFDDYKRHRLDRVENSRTATVLRPARDASGARPGRGRAREWTAIKWRDVEVGDVLRLDRDDDVPADAVLLHVDSTDGVAYVETMALDGETNLKSKQASPAFAGCEAVDGIRSCAALVVAENPNPDLYRFDGRVTLGDKVFPLTPREVILRGSTVRNTVGVSAVVINTGEDCKIRRNANRHPKAKKPALEAVANKIVLTLAVYVVLLSAGCSVGYLVWQRSTERISSYLDGAAVGYHQIIIGFAIQFNNLIPLALYVSLEIVKIGQMMLLNSDAEMYDEESDTPAKCNTNTILEDLGQIGYVCSDKTGTLTRNVMEFRRMTIAGTTWQHERSHQAADSQASRLTTSVEAPEGRTPTPSTDDLVEFMSLRPDSVFAIRASEFLRAIALCNTCVPEVRQGETEYQGSSPDELALVRAAQELGFAVQQRSPQSTTIRVTAAGDREDTAEEYKIMDVLEFSSKRKRMSVIVQRPDGRLWLICKGADSTILPRLRMADLAIRTVHEVRQSLDEEKAIRRKSEHGDPRDSFGGPVGSTLRRSFAIAREKSLSRRPAAVRSRSFEAAKVRRSNDVSWSPGTAQARSTDTSSMRQTNPQAFPRLPVSKISAPDDAALADEATVFARCFEDLNDFAAEGLRTLLFAHRFIAPQEYETWKGLYLDASTSLLGRQEKMEQVEGLIEQNLDLMAASAIEDKLQDGVPDTIDRLRRAGIKIWMLTGDKRETAVNIAHSARICKPESDIFILDADEGDFEARLLAVSEDIHTAASQNHTVVVIDGHALNVAGQGSTELRKLFDDVLLRVDSVICCRASPRQKSLLVRTIRSAHPTGSRCGLTLAIGDGSNDLAMLAEAHVGVGISGREGLQAARVADFSISQFRFLGRLLLVHGRWNYSRTASFVLWTFWKECFFYVATVLYQCFDGSTGTSLYENWSLTVLNTLFTSLCVIVPGVFEKELGADVLMAVPELYRYGQQARGLNLLKWARWMLAGTAEGTVVFLVCWAGYGLLGEFEDQGLFALGDLVFSVAMMWINWKLL